MKTALITGGNSGIGFECARQLAREGYKVIIASRNEESSAKAVQQINQETGSEVASAKRLDLGSLADVRAFAASLKDTPIHALVCNAGLQVTKGPTLNADGFESTFAVNHLGHFLLVNLLLPTLSASTPARIVVVASGVHDPDLFTGMPKPSISDFQALSKGSEGAFNGQQTYANSKLCNLWFIYELVRRIEGAGLKNITVNGYEPGLVPGSGLAREYSSFQRFMWEKILPTATRVITHFTSRVNTASKAGRALAKLVTSQEIEGVTGKYYPSHTAWREAPSSKDSYDLEKAKQLWEESIKMTKLTRDETTIVFTA